MLIPNDITDYPVQEQAKSDVLLMAIGNTSRQDDGLAWAFANKLRESGCFTGHIHPCYQLQVEDSELITHYSSVIFVDASHNDLPNGYDFRAIRPDNDFTFTTHALSPMGLLYLCETLYNKCPKAFILEIKGYQWELEEGLSVGAKKSLDASLKFVFDELSKQATNSDLKHWFVD